MAYLEDQLKELIGKFEEHKIEYALCGGLAMAVHGLPRATVDLDFLIEPASWVRVEEVGDKLGFILKASPMSFAQGSIEIRRISKIDPDQNVLTLDALLVTPAIADVWASRQQIPWENGKIWVVSREGLIKLKRMSGRPQDNADISRLESLGNES